MARGIGSDYYRQPSSRRGIDPRMSAFGYMYATNREIALREIEDVLERCEGNVSRAAHELGVTRTYFYKILWRDGDTLLPIIDRIRTAALARIAARRRMLTGEPNGPR